MENNETSQTKSIINEMHNELAVEVSKKVNAKKTNEVNEIEKMDSLFQQLAEGTCDIDEVVADIYMRYCQSNNNKISEHFQNNLPYEVFLSLIFNGEEEQTKAYALQCLADASESESFDPDSLINEEIFNIFIESISNETEFISKPASILVKSILSKSPEKWGPIAIGNQLLEKIMSMPYSYNIAELLETLCKINFPDESFIIAIAEFITRVLRSPPEDQMTVELTFDALISLLKNNEENLHAEQFFETIIPYINPAQSIGSYTRALEVVMLANEAPIEIGNILIQSLEGQNSPPIISLTCNLICKFNDQWEELLSPELAIVILHKLNKFKVAVEISLIRALLICVAKTNFFDQDVIKQLMNHAEMTEVAADIFKMFCAILQGENEEAKSIILEGNMDDIAAELSMSSDQDIAESAEQFLSLIEDE